jgi:hypothetical protein
LLRASGTGAYTLLLTYDEQPVASDVEPNNALSALNETLITNGVSLNGVIGYVIDGTTDTNDYFSFSVGANGTVNITVEQDPGLETRLHFLRTNGSGVSSTSAGQSGTYTLSTDCMGAALYVVRVQRTSGCGAYTLTATVDEPTATNDLEPNNSISTAQVSLIEQVPVEGQLGHTTNGTTDPMDYYILNNTANGNIEISIELEAGLTARAYFMRPTGSSISISPAGGFTGSYTFEIPCQGADTYYVGLQHISGCGGYQLSYTLHQPEFANDNEPNNSIAQANQTLIENQPIVGQVGHATNAGTDTQDYFIVTKERNGDITFDLNCSDGLVGRIFTYRPTGGLIGSSPAGGGENVSFTLACRGIETIFVAVERISGCGSYELSYSIDDPTYATDIEPNDAYNATQEQLPENGSVTGHLGYVSDSSTDSSDSFEFVKTQNGELTLEVETEEGLEVSITVLRTNGVTLGTSAAGTSAELVLQCRGIETLAVRVNHVSGCGSYILSSSVADFTYANDNEPNNSTATATPIQLSDVLEGHLGTVSITTLDTDDFYAFTVTEAPFDFLAVAEFVDGLEGRLALQTDLGSTIASFPASGGLPGEVTLAHTFNSPGNYIFRVIRTAECGSYTVGPFCAQPPVVSISTGDPTEFCPGGSAQLQASTAYSGYSWLLNGNEISQNPSITAPASGTYQLVGFDVNGCAGFSNVLDLEVIIIDGDINVDGVVNSGDLSLFLSLFGCNQNCGSADLNDDGVVNSSDLSLFLANFGSICIQP